MRDAWLLSRSDLSYCQASFARTGRRGGRTIDAWVDYDFAPADRVLAIGCSDNTNNGGSDAGAPT